MGAAKKFTGNHKLKTFRFAQSITTLRYTKKEKLVHDHIKKHFSCLCTYFVSGPNCYLNERIISEGELVYDGNCKECSCEEGGIVTNGTREAVCSRSIFCL